MMALLAKVGTFNAGTGAIGTTVAVTGVGFQPKVLILWTAGLTGVQDGWVAGTHQRSFGVATSPTSRWAIASQSENTQTAADCDRRHHADCCLATLSAAGALTRLFDLQSFDSDGFTLVNDMASSQDQRIHYLALGGADITDAATGRFDEPAATGSQAISGVGFQPGFLLFGSIGNTTDPPATATDSTFMVGAAVSATQEAVFCGESEHASATMDTQSYCRSGECIALIGGTEVTDARAELQSMDADGFTLNWLERTNSRVIFWLALKGGSYAVGDFVTSTSNGATIPETGLGFAPKGVLLTSAGAPADTQDAVSNHDQWACGAFTGPTERGAQVTFDENGVADSDIERAFENDQCLAQFTAAPGYVGLVDVQSMDADGFTLVMDSAANPAAFAWYAAFGDGGSALHELNLSSTVTAASARQKTVVTARPSSTTPVGVLTRRVAITRSASLTPASSHVIQRFAVLVFTGTVTGAGTFARLLLKPWSSAVTPSTVLSRVAHYVRSFGSTVSPDGVLGRRTEKPLTSSLTAAGALARALTSLRTLASTVTPAGVAGKQVQVAQASSVTPAGAMERLKVKILGLSSTLGLSGVLAALVRVSYASTVSPSGIVTRRVSTSRTSAITAAGAVLAQRVIVRSFTSSVTAVTALARLVSQTHSSTVAGSGVATKLTATSQSSMVGVSGAFHRSGLKPLFSSLGLGGVLTRLSRRDFPSTVVATDVRTTSRPLTLSSTVSATDLQSREAQKTFSSAIVAGGTLVVASFITAITRRFLLFARTQLRRLVAHPVGLTAAAAAERVLMHQPTRAVPVPPRIRTLQPDEDSMADLPRFSPKRSAESDNFTIDFLNQLAAAETLTAPVVTVTVSSDSLVPDPDELSLTTDGAAVVSGSRVVQKLQGGVNGCLYVVAYRVTTSTGRVLEAAALLLVQDATA